MRPSPASYRGRVHFKRVIPCLDVDAGRVVKGVEFLDIRDAGDPVELAARYEADPEKDLIVLYDELALPFGSIRVRERGSAGGHNGVKSIIACLGGSQEFLRVRLGIGPEFKPASGRDYVLSPIKKAQLPLKEQALEAASDAVRMILTQGASAAMNRFNQKVNGAGQAE